MKMYAKAIFIMLFSAACLSCKDDPSRPTNGSDIDNDEFVVGADLSYVNQVLDHGGSFKDEGVAMSPYKIFKDHGSKVVRLRLWHNPVWTKEVYGGLGTQAYSDLADVSKAISFSKEQGMSVLLDIHYSDTWADPDKQEIPYAWKDIESIDVLKDSVYNYTAKVFRHLAAAALIPEYVQIGNEINCGMLYTNAATAFPACKVCNGQWQRMGSVVNAAILAVRDITNVSPIETKVILHVADPKNVEWWFDNITHASMGNVRDFDMIGFSYYPLWHQTVGIDQISDNISKFRNKYNKGVIVVETAYPWTSASDDSYSNVFGSQTPLTGYPFSSKGQLDLMVKLTEEVLAGGGQGIIYWEPAWISSDMRDPWGTGSSWENCTFFDFDGKVIEGINFMSYDYKR